ncbi:MAG: hypothetical protein IPI62_05685 [Bacteroidetes bacterium]|nr:hypothetical protein [Bacteroidota bacterium]
MRLKKTSILLIFIILQIRAGASNSDSAFVTVPTSIRYIHELDFRDGNTNFQRPDTSLYSLDRVNLASDNNYNYLGVRGSAAQSPWFTNMSEIYTRALIRSYDLYTTSSDSVRYYNVNKKFTEIKYNNGTFKDQVISVLHTQNVLKNWNLGFDFSRLSVKDYMPNSDTYKGDFLLFSTLRSNNGKYNLFAHAYWKEIENQMNGGLANDSTFLYGNVDNVAIRSLAWKISDAYQYHRTKRFHLNQYYDFGGSKVDSVGKIIPIPAIRFNYQVTFERSTIAYKDPTTDSTFYSNYFYSPSTYDSSIVDVLTNEFALILPADQLRKSAFFRNWSMSVAAEHQSTKYEQKEKKSWDNLAVSGKIISKYDSSDFNATVFAKYVLSGYDNGNYVGDVQINTKQYVFGSFGGRFTMNQQSPDYYLLSYKSNNFIWENDLTKTKTTAIQLNYSLSKYKFSIIASRQQIENATFINEFATPEQLGNKLTIDQLKIEKNFRFKTIYFLNAISVQKNDNENKIHLSPLFSQHALYYEKSLFGNKLMSSVGFNFTYSSSYFSDAFMPSTALFYYQNETKSGGYLRADLFIRAKIKSAQFFLKLENVADNLGKQSYFLVPHYPQPGMVLRFGIVWRFFDQS